MSADININDKFSSYEELLVFKGNYEKYNFIQLYTRTSQTLDYFTKRNPSRKASVNLKYSRIELACRACLYTRWKKMCFRDKWEKTKHLATVSLNNC